MKTQKSQEEIRAGARDRKRAQREREHAARDELRVASMESWELRIHEIMDAIGQEPRKPQPPRAPGPPQPAHLPNPEVWLKYLQSLRPTQAIAEEIDRVEAAIASGMNEFPRQIEEESNA